jgi:hypothetical protein
LPAAAIRWWYATMDCTQENAGDHSSKQGRQG